MLSDDEIMQCALDVVLERIEAGDRVLEDALRQSLVDFATVKRLEADLALVGEVSHDAVE